VALTIVSLLDYEVRYFHICAEMAHH